MNAHPPLYGERSHIFKIATYKAVTHSRTNDKSAYATDLQASSVASRGQTAALMEMGRKQKWQ